MRFLFVLALSCTSVALATDPQAPRLGGGPYVKPCAPTDLSWGYYGLNGGPYITTVQPARTLGVTPPIAVKPSSHKPAIAVYGPVPMMEDNGDKPRAMVRTRGVGWGGYLTPSPR